MPDRVPATPDGDAELVALGEPLGVAPPDTVTQLEADSEPVLQMVALPPVTRGVGESLAVAVVDRVTEAQADPTVERVAEAHALDARL